MDKLAVLRILIDTSTHYYTKKINIISWFMDIREITVEDAVSIQDGQVVKVEGRLQMNHQGEIIRIEGTDTKLFDFSDPVTLPANFLMNQTTKITTTYGRVLINALLLVDNFKAVIPYMDGMFSARSIDNIIADHLVDDPSPYHDVPDAITVKNYERFVKAGRMLMMLAPFVITSATRKSLTPATGMDAYRKKMEKKFDMDTELGQTAFKEALAAYDREYLKDDPSLDILMTGKTLNKGRGKLFGAFGTENTMGVGKMTKFIGTSQYNGLPTDKETVADLNTSMRAASYYRGKLTAGAGTLGKLISALMARVKTVDGDCGTKEYLTHYVTKDREELVDHYYVEGGKVKLCTLLDLQRLDKKVVPFRSAGLCKHPTDIHCRVCSGEKAFENKDSLSNSASDMSGKVLQLFLSSVHGVQTDSIVTPLDEIVDWD